MNIYNADSVPGMYEAGRIAALALDKVEEILAQDPYRTTEEIDKICADFIQDNGGIAECIGYKSKFAEKPYLHATCISVNEVACHGVPSAYRLKEGDIVNVDLVVRFPGKDGWLADTSRSFGIGNISDENQQLLKFAKNAMYAGMRVVRKGIEFKYIGAAIESYCKTKKMGNKQVKVIPNFCGHGVSKKMHEAPLIEHLRNSCNVIIRPYHYFTIEPIITLGENVKNYEESDGWTIKMSSGANAAQFEHTMGLNSEGKLMIFTTRDRAHEEEVLKEISALS